jgi:hypothetical protein
VTTVGRLQSNNRKYELLVQHDGNLVLYEVSPFGSDPVRDTGTRANRAVMQQDGNFVIYDSAGVSRWHIGTWDNPGSKLVLQDDREVVFDLGHAPCIPHYWIFISSRRRSIFDELVVSYWRI